MHLRTLPSVDQVLQKLKQTHALPQCLIVSEIRAELAERRNALLAGLPVSAMSIEEAVEQRLENLLQPSFRRVVNATGVILHTNLGRAPLVPFEPLTGYSNLEYDLKAGERGKRDQHISALLERVLGKPAIVVNNNAAAVFLVLNELAAGYEVIVSRGELIEIGDGFRIPDIMARSGAILREVGTTNQTRISDYEAAINERTRLILRVHRSNFRISGFTQCPALEELVTLGRKYNLPIYEDLGSGCLINLRTYGIDEPLVFDSVQAGVSLVSFSGDKLLGGPQAGIIAGQSELVQRVRRNPLYRAFRVDKLTIQALTVTFGHVIRQNWKDIPALRMIMQNLEEIHDRACYVVDQIRGVPCEVNQNQSAVGGGSTPSLTLPTWVIELSVPEPDHFAAQLRQSPVPIVARIERDRVILDMRTVADDELDWIVSAVNRAAAIQ
jgi:L-seryl-tRNA(Ser) seleniumtransferase